MKKIINYSYITRWALKNYFEQYPDSFIKNEQGEYVMVSKFKSNKMVDILNSIIEEIKGCNSRIFIIFGSDTLNKISIEEDIKIDMNRFNQIIKKFFDNGFEKISKGDITFVKNLSMTEENLAYLL